jgi:hypothetical protein
VCISKITLSARSPSHHKEPVWLPRFEVGDYLAGAWNMAGPLNLPQAAIHPANRSRT